MRTKAIVVRIEVVLCEFLKCVMTSYHVARHYRVPTRLGAQGHVVSEPCGTFYAYSGSTSGLRKRLAVSVPFPALVSTSAVRLRC